MQIALGEGRSGEQAEQRQGDGEPEGTEDRIEAQGDEAEIGREGEPPDRGNDPIDPQEAGRLPALGRRGFAGILHGEGLADQDRAPGPGGIEHPDDEGAVGLEAGRRDREGRHRGETEIAQQDPIHELHGDIAAGHHDEEQAGGQPDGDRHRPEPEAGERSIDDPDHEAG